MPLFNSETLPTKFPLGKAWAPYVSSAFQNRRRPAEIDYVDVMNNSEVQYFFFSLYDHIQLGVLRLFKCYYSCFFFLSFLIDFI